MGTRADFYVGRGKEARWLGSIAWDGYPDGITNEIKLAETEECFIKEVMKELGKRKDSTLPVDGWPWPWNDSRTTDYAYAFEGGKVWASCFGSEWFDPMQEPEHDNLKEGVAVFPDMEGIKNVNLGRRSGIIIIGPKGVENK